MKNAIIFGGLTVLSISVAGLFVVWDSQQRLNEKVYTLLATQADWDSKTVGFLCEIKPDFYFCSLQNPPLITH